MVGGSGGKGVMISHLLFVDDTLVFGKDDQDQLTFLCWLLLLFNVLNGLNEERLKVRWHQNAPRHLLKDVGHGRLTSSYLRLLRGVNADAFFAS